MTDGAWQPPERISSRRRRSREAAITRRPTAAGWRSPGSPTARARHRRPSGGRAAPAPPVRRRRRRAPASRRHGHQRARPTPCGRRAATCAPRGCEGTRGRRSPPPLDIDPARSAGAGTLAPAGGGQRRGQRGRRVGGGDADGARTCRAPADRAQPVRRSRRTCRWTTSRAGRPATPTRRTSTSRTTARSPGSCSGRTSAGARARSPGACSARSSRRRRRSTAGRRASTRGSTSRARASAAPSPQTADNGVFSAYLDKFDAFQPGVRIDADGRRDRARAGGRHLRARRRVRRLAHGRPAQVAPAARTARRRFEPEFQASTPAFGAVAPGPIAIGADRSGNTAVAMVQGAGAAPPADRRGLRPAARAARGPELDDATAPGAALRGPSARRTGARRRSRVLSTARRSGRRRATRHVADAARQRAAPLPGQRHRPPRPEVCQPRAHVPRGRGPAEPAAAGEPRAGRQRSACARWRPTAGRPGWTTCSVDFGDGARSRRSTVRHRYQARPLHASACARTTRPAT